MIKCHWNSIIHAQVDLSNFIKFEYSIKHFFKWRNKFCSFIDANFD